MSQILFCQKYEEKSEEKLKSSEKCSEERKAFTELTAIVDGLHTNRRTKLSVEVALRLKSRHRSHLQSSKSRIFALIT